MKFLCNEGLKVEIHGKIEVSKVSSGPFWAMLARTWAVLAHVGAMLGHHWQQDGCLIVISAIKNAKMNQDGAQGVANLSQDGILGSELEVWRDLGRSWGSLGGHFERCWLEVGLSWLMLELCCDISGDKMAAKMAKMAIKSAKMSQEGAQEVAKLS